jgi:SAM-dependent methyltransferase
MRQLSKHAYRLATRAYRHTLGRNPATDRIARGVIARFRESRWVSNLASPLAVDGALPVFLPQLAIETTASPQELREMWTQTRQAWEQLGSERPFHSVLTEPRYLPGTFAEAERDFWQSGESEASVLAGYLADLGLLKLENASALEYGCGVGRVTVPLAGHVRTMTAYDLSAPHLALARERAALMGRSNVRLVLLENPLGAEFDSCDLFYSRIVLQHNPPPIIGHLLRNLIRALKPGGLGIFQVPTYGVGYNFRVAEYLGSMKSSDTSLNMEMHCYPQAELFSLIAQEGARVVQVRDDNATGRPDLYVSNTFVIRKS